MVPRTNQSIRIICMLALSFGSFTIASGAAAQSAETGDAASLSSPVKKKKTGASKKKKKGKKKNPKGNLGNPEASTEFDTDLNQKSVESSGSAWIFIISMITFMAGIIFWYTKHQAAESAKHLSDLDFADDNKPGQPTNDQQTRNGQESDRKKHPLETSMPVFAEEAEKMASGSDLNSRDPEATMMVYPNSTQNNNQPARPGAATVIIAPLAATKIIAQETREAKPIKKS